MMDCIWRMQTTRSLLMSLLSSSRSIHAAKQALRQWDCPTLKKNSIRSLYLQCKLLDDLVGVRSKIDCGGPKLSTNRAIIKGFNSILMAPFLGYDKEVP